MGEITMAHLAVIEALNTKIAELEKEQADLQSAVRKLAEVSGKLAALRTSLAVLSAGKDTTTTATTDSGLHLNGDTPSSLAASRLVPGSIGYLALEALRDAGKPLHVKELLPKIRAKGKPGLNERTLISVLCGYVNHGKLKRPAPSTYAL